MADDESEDATESSSSPWHFEVSGGLGGTYVGNPAGLVVAAPTPAPTQLPRGRGSTQVSQPTASSPPWDLAGSLHLSGVCGYDLTSDLQLALNGEVGATQYANSSSLSGYWGAASVNAIDDGLPLDLTGGIGAEFTADSLGAQVYELNGNLAHDLPADVTGSLQGGYRFSIASGPLQQYQAPFVDVILSRSIDPLPLSLEVLGEGSLSTYSALNRMDTELTGQLQLGWQPFAFLELLLRARGTSVFSTQVGASYFDPEADIATEVSWP